MNRRAGAAERRRQILEVLARELEKRPGTRITTARLAAELGVSEAALYRHFPSKAKMFEALIAFAEETVFGVIAKILGEEADGRERVRRILQVMLTFSSRNPGITRILLGDALVGEHERLRERAAQFFERLETLVRQILRESRLRESVRANIAPTEAARVITTCVQGAMAGYVRSGFRQQPSTGLEPLWAVLVGGLFAPRPGGPDA